MGVNVDKPWTLETQVKAHRNRSSEQDAEDEEIHVTTKQNDCRAAGPRMGPPPTCSTDVWSSHQHTTPSCGKRIAHMSRDALVLTGAPRRGPHGQIRHPDSCA